MHILEAPAFLLKLHPAACTATLLRALPMVKPALATVAHLSIARCLRLLAPVQSISQAPHHNTFGRCSARSGLSPPHHALSLLPSHPFAMEPSLIIQASTTDAAGPNRLNTSLRTVPQGITWAYSGALTCVAAGQPRGAPPAGPQSLEGCHRRRCCWRRCPGCWCSWRSPAVRMGRRQHTRSLCARGAALWDEGCMCSTCA